MTSRGRSEARRRPLNGSTGASSPLKGTSGGRTASLACDGTDAGAAAVGLSAGLRGGGGDAGDGGVGVVSGLFSPLPRQPAAVLAWAEAEDEG